MKKPYEQAVEELTLMLLYLTRFPDNRYARFLEPSWKGYDFDVLNTLEEKEYLYQPNKTKISYLSEDGKARARELLSEYGISDKPITERFEFRDIRPEEAEQAIAIEQICFPPNEACAPDTMRERIKTAPDCFLAAIDKQTGKLAGFLNGLATDEIGFRDEFCTDVSLHKPDGRVILLLGLDVLPEYRKQGLARELVYQYCRRQQERNRRLLILTCKQAKVKMYKRFGFEDQGISTSTWGGEQWHEMTCVIG